MRQFTLKQLLVGIGILSVVIALAAPALRGDRSSSSRYLLFCSVVLLCTVIGGVIGAVVGRFFKHSIVGAIVLAIAGFLLGAVKGCPLALARLDWPRRSGMASLPSEFEIWLFYAFGIGVVLLPVLPIIGVAIYFSVKKSAEQKNGTGGQVQLRESAEDGLDN